MGEYEQLRLWEDYEPQIDDYVIWDSPGRTDLCKDEGWVYFKCNDYITIETGVRPRPKCEYTNGKTLHKMVHTLVLCHEYHWHQLKWVKSRKRKHI